MMRAKIFDEVTLKAVDYASSVFKDLPYFRNNFNLCKGLLMNRRNPKEAAKAVLLGVQHARLLNLDSDIFPVVYIDWLLPDSYEQFYSEGIPKWVFQDSMKDISIWIDVFQKTHNGKIGLDQVEWVFKSLIGQVRRFGSLQFEEVTYDFSCLIFKNRVTEEYVGLARSSLKVDEDGYLIGTNGRKINRAITTSLNLEEGIVTGFPADLKRGYLSTEKTSLNLSDWNLELAPGEKAIAVHIPEGANLCPDKVDSSINAARDYYYGKFLVCDSWLLDPHLEFILPENSRILNFMKRFYKMPVKVAAPQILERVMGFDYSTKKAVEYPSNTSLQSALRKYILEGNEMFTTAGFMPWK